MIYIILSSFIFAFAAPYIHRIFKKFSHWVIFLLPLGIFSYFMSYLPRICTTECEVFTFTYPWIRSLGIQLSFYLDGLSMIFALIITGVGMMVIFYSGAYFKGHPQHGRFYLYILIFMGSMLGVVMAENLITIFVFWELTSLSSYLLIGFNHEKEESRKAALQALLVTGLGGLALLAGFILTGIAGGTYSIAKLLDSGDIIRNHALYLPALALVLTGAFTKSAQVPFHFWLPSAMQAPTPVSTYLHSATMVKAGIYLLARFNPIMGSTLEWNYLITIAGVTTMLVGALMALYQTDLKKLLAYTTVSALGMLVLLLGIGTTLAIKAAMVFLMVHALYKGALFMIVGAVDHSTGTRDVTRLSGLMRVMPFIGIAAAFSGLSMSGFPPLLGFVGKELIYEAHLHAPNAAITLMTASIIGNAVNVTVAIMVGIFPFWGKTSATAKKAHPVQFAFWIGPFLMSLCGVILGIMPNSIAMPLISPAVTAIKAQTILVELKTWHGVTLVFMLSVLTVALGIGFFHFREKFRKFAPGLKFLIPFSPSRVYDYLLKGMLRFADLQTRFLQNGKLRYYLITIVLVTVSMVCTQLFRMKGFPVSISFSGLQFYEAGLVLVMFMATIMAMVTPSRMAAVASLGVIGFGVAMIYVLFGAPDLALTQFLVETLTVIIFVLVIYHLPYFQEFSSTKSRIRDAIVAFLAGSLMTILILTARHVQIAQQISTYFSENSAPLAHGRDIVNVILVDFRAIDTMGEITVLSIAAIGVYALIKLKPKKEKGQ